MVMCAMKESKRNKLELVLDSGTWRHLPEELIAKVLRKVPYRSVGLLRLVCKKWNAFILSDRFVPDSYHAAEAVLMQLQSGNLPAKIRDQVLTIYCKSSNSWQERSLSFVGGVEAIPGEYFLAAAHGGLLCYRDFSAENLVMLNPLTKQWKVLSPSIWGPQEAEQETYRSTFCNRDSHSLVGLCTLVGLCVDSKAGTYKLLVAGMYPDDFPRATLVYDSLRGSWKAGGKLDTVLPDCQQHRKWFCNLKSVCFKGSFYWLLEPSQGSSIQMILKYDLERNMWSHSRQNARPGDVVPTFWEHLVISRGKLVLQIPQLSYVSPSRQGRGINLPQVQGAGILRVVNQAMPEWFMEQRRRDLRAVDYEHENYYIVGYENLTFLVALVSHKQTTLGWRVCIHNSKISEDSCTWLLGKESKSESLHSWWAFVPSLIAPG